jgi:hypothetical protein
MVMKLFSNILKAILVLACATIVYITVRGLIGLLLAFLLSSLTIVLLDMIKDENVVRDLYCLRIPVKHFKMLKQFLLVFICVMSLASLYLIPPMNISLYVAPENIPLANWFRHFSAILLTTFIPGFLILSIIDHDQMIDGFNRLILAYILSLFLLFLCGYIIILSGNRISDQAVFTVSTLNAILLIIYLLRCSLKSYAKRKDSHKIINSYIVYSINTKLFYSITFWLLVIGLVMVLTWGQYGTQIIADQQNHHGYVILLSLLQLPKDALAIPSYPYLFHIYLAMLFVSSGIPSINAYNSLNFLNIMPILAFYAMVKAMFDDKTHADAIAAFSTFFAFFTSGFGWIYVLSNMFNAGARPFSEIIYTAWTKTYDILTPNSFIVAGHPDPTTPLLLVGLPSMFTLFQLSLTNQKFSNKLKYCLIAVTTACGFLGHIEFALMIVVILIASLLRKDFLKIHLSLLVALCIVYMVDALLPNRYYSTVAINILGYQFPAVLFLIASISMILPLAVFLRRISSVFPDKTKVIQRIKAFYKRFDVYVFSVIIMYLYLLAFIVWDTVQANFTVWDTFGYDGSVPWYFYPIRLGVTGLIAVTGSLYWLSTKNIGYIKKISPLYVWILVVIIARHSYLEYRLIKHLYLPLSVIAGFVLYYYLSKTLMQQTTFKLKKFIHTRISGSIYSKVKIRGEHVVALLLMVIVILSCMSPLLCIRAVKDHDSVGVSSVLSMRNPLSQEELEALNWLRLNIDPMNDVVLFLPDGRKLGSEVVNFGGAWDVLSKQYVPIFEVSIPENLLDLLNKMRPKYLYINQRDFAILKSDKKYTYSCIKNLIDYLPVAFNNSKVTIYEFPKLAPPLRSSSISFVIPSTIVSFIPVSQANLNYSIIHKNDPAKYGSNVLILPEYPNQKELEGYLKWVKNGGHLIIFDFPPMLEKKYGVMNRTLYGFDTSSRGWKISENGTIRLYRGSLLSEETIEGDYIVSAYVKVTRIENPSDNHLGLLFNYKDKNNYYYVFLRQDKLVLFKMYNGTGKELYWVDVKRNDGTFQKLSVRVNAPIFRFYVDDTFVGEYLDRQFIGKGKVGLRTYNLIGDFLGINIKLFPIKVKVDGITKGDTLINIPEVEVPLVNETFLSDGTVFVDAYFTSNGVKKTPFSLTVAFGKGNITYINFSPLFDFLKISQDQNAKRWLFSKLGEIFRLVKPNLPYQQNITNRTSIEPIPFIRGLITSSGKLTLRTTSFWFAEQTPLCGIIDLSNVTKLKIGNNYHKDSPERLSNVTILNYTINGPIETFIQASYIRIAPSNSGAYSLVELNDTFTLTMHILDGATVNLTLLANGSITKISASGGLIQVNILNAKCVPENSNHKLFKIYMKYPLIELNGSTFMENAYLSTGPKSVIVYGLPVTIVGQISFQVDSIDQGTVRISNLSISGEIIFQKLKGKWNEWDINWMQVITSPYHFILIASTLTVILYPLYRHAKRK